VNDQAALDAGGRQYLGGVVRRRRVRRACRKQPDSEDPDKSAGPLCLAS
jgi:hypothetical protein